MRDTGARRRRVLSAVFTAVVLLVAGLTSPAGAEDDEWGALATLHALNPVVCPGKIVKLFGKNYSGRFGDGNIEIRLDTRNGTVIGSLSPRQVLDNIDVTIPRSTIVGSHLLLATQLTSQGVAVSGTPGRTSVVVSENECERGPYPVPYWTDPGGGMLPILSNRPYSCEAQFRFPQILRELAWKVALKHRTVLEGTTNDPRRFQTITILRTCQVPNGQVIFTFGAQPDLQDAQIAEVDRLRQQALLSGIWIRWGEWPTFHAERVALRRASLAMGPPENDGMLYPQEMWSTNHVCSLRPNEIVAAHEKCHFWVRDAGGVPVERLSTWQGVYWVPPKCYGGCQDTLF